MDTMPLLRRYREAVPEPGAARMAAIRARLDARTARPEPRRDLLPRVAFAAAGTAIVAGVVVAAVTAGPAPRASAAAVRVLDAAGARAAAQSATRTLVIRSVGLAEHLDARGRLDAAYLDEETSTLTVPVGDGTWVRSRVETPPSAFFGAGRRLAAAEGAFAPGCTTASPCVERSADGTFTNGELGGGSLFGDDPAALRALPRDPVALVAALRRADVGVEDGGQAVHVLQAASTVLASGAADADLQVAVFRALRLQPGIAVTDDAVDLLGRSGVAIGVADPAGASDTRQLIVDPGSGTYLGDRDVLLVPEGVLPVGTVTSATAVTRG